MPDTPKRWRVHYHLYAAGGGLTATWLELARDFDTPEAAIEATKAWQRSRDHEQHRAPLGYFAKARAEPLT